MQQYMKKHNRKKHTQELTNICAYMSDIHSQAVDIPPPDNQGSVQIGGMCPHHEPMLFECHGQSERIPVPSEKGVNWRKLACCPDMTSPCDTGEFGQG